MRISHSVDCAAVDGANRPRDRLRRKTSAAAADASLQIIGIKCYLDGGMLTAAPYMREPWGLSEIYSITDPRYRGVLFIEAENCKQSSNQRTSWLAIHRA